MDYFKVERQKPHNPDSMNHNINSNVKSKFKWVKSTMCLVWNLTIVPQLSTLLRGRSDEFMVSHKYRTAPE